MRITFISDTHIKHSRLQLPGGDLLIHAGDSMNTGYYAEELKPFLSWFESQRYDECVFIAGNHDRIFETHPESTSELVNEFDVEYLEDRHMTYTNFIDREVKIYGSPWQPEFYNWAFNLPRCSQDLMRVWNCIPEDVDILVTHGPPQGHLDISGPPYNEGDLGCELLRVRVDEIKPKIHVFGHIHGGYGYKFHNGTHFINASVLNEQYEQVNKPLTVDWNPETNELTFI